MIDPETDSDLKNWARWCNSGSDGGPPVQQRAASAEGRHIPDADHVFADLQDRPIPVNSHRAAVVQLVYDERLSHAERKVLQSAYPHRGRYVVPGRGFSEWRAARRLGMPAVVYRAMLGRCARLVRQAFEERR